MSLTDSNRGLPDQPGPTCPMIDDAISSADEIDNYLDSVEDENEEVELSDVREDVNDRIRDVSHHAEAARENIIEIRDWGQEWKDYALRLEDEEGEWRQAYEELEEEKDNLEREKSELEDELEELKISLSREQQEDL